MVLEGAIGGEGGEGHLCYHWVTESAIATSEWTEEFIVVVPE